MKNMLQNVGVLLLCASAFSCSKDGDKATTVKADDYFPNTTGATWTYIGANASTMTVTGSKKSFDGKSYSEIESVDGSNAKTSYYLYKEKGDYYLRGTFDEVDLNMLVLKDNVAKGFVWTDVETKDGIRYTQTCTLVEKDFQENINGVDYSNVIIVNVRLSFNFQGSVIDLVNLTFHFAKGIGIVRINSQYDLGDEQTDLETYSIP